MSAGIIIMNKTAIALAADSAVTVGNRSAIHNSANKLFALSKYAPVGAIIYANASLMQIPVELIIKEYRKGLGNASFSSLEEYGTDFLNYLEKKHALFRFETNEKKYVLGLAYNLLSGMKNDYERHIKNKVDEVQRELTKTELKEIQKTTIKETIDYVSKLDKLPNADFSRYVKDKYSNELLKMMKDLFDWIGKQQSKDLLKHTCSIYNLDFFRNGYVGMAIAGYGTSEIFPQTNHYCIGGVINGKVRYRIINKYNITEDNYACVIPLAQIDVMQTFLFGINDSLINEMANEMAFQLDERMKTVSDDFFATGKKQDLLATLSDATLKVAENIANSAYKKYMRPILDSVGSLPIEELTSFAESLISITSARRQVALDNNIGTVGGPIDVAVISRGDGFIWLKRKHYFDVKDNVQYLINNYSSNSIGGFLNGETKEDK